MNKPYFSLFEKLCAALCLGLVLGSQPLSAQAPEAPPSAAAPAGPLLKSAPEFSKWNIAYAFAKGEGAPPVSGDLSRRAVVTKTRNIIHEEIFDGRGCCLDTWYLGPQQYRKPHGKDAWFVSEPARTNTAQDSDYDPLPANGFRGWDWVGAESYVGQMENEGRQCLVFVPGGPAKLQGESLKESLQSQSHVAYVDASSRLPVSLRSGNVTQSFRFESLPPVMQELPPKLVEQIKQTEESRKKLLQAAPRPY